MCAHSASPAHPFDPNSSFLRLAMPSLSCSIASNSNAAPLLLNMFHRKALKTMKIGERKRFRLKAPLSPSDHPSSSKTSSVSESGEPMEVSETLTALDKEEEVVLLSCDKVEHIVNGGSIVKRRIYCPIETQNDKHTPAFETVVTLDMVGRVEATNEVFDERLNCDFRIGEGELGMGMEKSVRSMHRGEKAQFVFLHPWPVSLCTNPKIPIADLKNTSVVYEVTLKSFVDAKTPFECKTYEDHLAEAKLRHEQGNRAHEAKLYTLAITKYTKAQLYLEQFNDFKTPEEQETYAQLKVTLWLNLAAANLKLEAYEKVKLHCTNALEIEPKNVKGLYRRASACVALNEYEQAQKDLALLLETEPQNALAKHLMKRVQQKFAKDAELEKQTYQRIFTKLEEPETKPLYEEPKKTDVQAPISSSSLIGASSIKWSIVIAILVLIIGVIMSLFRGK